MKFNANMADLFNLNPKLTFQPTTQKVPGKLYFVGEYAILEPGNTAILFSVNQYLTCQISLSRTPYSGSLQTSLQDLLPLLYRREADKVHFSLNGMDGLDSYYHENLMDEKTRTLVLEQWQYVFEAIRVVEELMQELGRPLQDYHIQYYSDLVAEDGSKYGLGSSAAVTIATIKSLLAFYGIEVKSPLSLFKLAAIALIRAGSNGSMGDVAAISFGGWVFYQSFDRKWLAAELDNQVSLMDLLEKEWPLLEVRYLDINKRMTLLIGWTQSAASTQNLVQQLTQRLPEKDANYRYFLEKSKLCVNNMRTAFEKADIMQIQEEMANYRHLLLKLSSHFNIEIETDKLKQFIQLSQAYQFEAKSSGAGGGDCGIAVGESNQKTTQLLDEWRRVGIIPLNLHVAPKQFN
ncbi:phosphomevalonate kinase [Fundicoccus culcitae]|uniref:phosphomevalonate kinase n=1 Tax=Fundicoccus culcitae TaxID=2969821 RepID=A0ABY5P257_9LACT|nr:phosphomevalonate kinase [Fundicoccus culcitae]UUX32792.1 phosphomevalonate kinase [Fundicoccus culcitae]